MGAERAERQSLRATNTTWARVILMTSWATLVVHPAISEAQEPEVVPLAAPPKGGEPLAEAEPVTTVDDEFGRVAIKLGVGHNILGQPDDPTGSDSLLGGSALSGNGFVLGATYELPPLLPVVLFETGLMLDISSGTGFEEYPDRRRDVRVEVTSIRVPVWAKVRLAATDRVSFVGGAGFDFLYGTGSSSTVLEEHIGAGDELILETTSVVSAYLVTAAAIEVAFDRFVIPLTGQFGFNPLAGDTTRERFDGYVSPTNRGLFRVEFDYQFIATLGLGYRL
jgi:hypothetical protein